MRKDTFIFYLEWLRTMDAAMLNKAEKSRLIDAIVAYADTGAVQDLPRLLMAIFQPIKTTIDKDTAKYIKKVEAVRENGKKGGRPKGAEKPNETKENQLGYFENQTKPKEKSLVSVYDNVNDNVNDYVFVNVAGTPAPSEEEKKELYEIFFWRNLAEPKAELERFIDYNAQRKWKALDTPTKRIAAACEWTPQVTAPRVRPEFLSMWHELYKRVKAEDPALAAQLIDCRARFEFQGNEAKLRIGSKALRGYIEDQQPPEIMDYIGTLRLITAAP